MTSRRYQKRIDREGPKTRGIVRHGHKEHEGSSLRFGGKCFRLITFQPVSLAVEDSKSFALSIQNIPCRLALRPLYTDAASQRTHGGTLLAIDFSLISETDFLAATKIGLDLVEDFLSAVSLVDGVTFCDAEPVQIVCTDPVCAQEHPFVYFFELSMYRWNRPISNTTIQAVRGLVLHWDGLDTGERLRRAARQFRKAVGTEDNLAAFQHAYMGLEAVEPPLANALGILPGAEEIKGRCNACGAEYTRRKTVLAGVRAYFCGHIHVEGATPERKEEWKEINELRQELFHSLKDSQESGQKIRKALPAAMHGLHDAICCLSHSHTLESPTFKLHRGMRRLVCVGQFRAAELGPLEECRLLLQVQPGYWVDHPEHGPVPEFELSRNSEIEDLEGVFFWLDAPLAGATKEDLIPSNWEKARGDKTS